MGDIKDIFNLINKFINTTKDRKFTVEILQIQSFVHSLQSENSTLVTENLKLKQEIFELKTEISRLKKTYAKEISDLIEKHSNEITQSTINDGCPPKKT